MIDEQEILKKFESLTIRDNFIFTRTMEMYPNLCQRLLEEILQVKISSIEYIEREKSIESRVDAKGIRLDVYVEDKTANRVFDVEMQISDVDHLSKRARYYQTLIDQDWLKRGESYKNLSKSYIIFICPFDRYGRGRYMYTFRWLCVEEPDIEIEDDATKIFLNTKGKRGNISEELKNFLRYVDNGVVSGNLVSDFDDAIKSVKIAKETRLSYMTLEMALSEREMQGFELGVEKGLQEGRQEGRQEEKNSIALTMLQSKMSLDLVQKFTGLSIEKIHELSKKISK